MGDSPITFLLIGITAITSYLAFQNVSLLNKLIFYPSDIKKKNEWSRMITHGFIHADFTHLIFNMFTLFFFGPYVESAFNSIFGNIFVYPLYYIGALIFSSVPSYFKHKDNQFYRALGASGAVSAVLFTTMIFEPWASFYVYFIKMPAIVFGVLYIAYSTYMSRKGNDNIGHDAHLYGALFGIIFPIILKPRILPYFIEQLSHPRFFS